MTKPLWHTVSFSGGKDSTAMLLGMLDRDMPIDEILFCDTTVEFPELLAHVDRIERDIGFPITRLRPDYTFEFLLKQFPPSGRKWDYPGYSWPWAKSRWCTQTLKQQPLTARRRALEREYRVIEYVGIAADEAYRLERKCNQRKDAVHPLVDWGMTEAEALRYCFDKGYDFGGLYDKFSRLGCWCCPLQGLDDLRALRRHWPDLWRTLREWDAVTWRDYKNGLSVEMLDARFAFEEERQAAGVPVQGKEFFRALRERWDDLGLRPKEKKSPTREVA